MPQPLERCARMGELLPTPERIGVTADLDVSKGGDFRGARGARRQNADVEMPAEPNCKVDHKPGFRVVFVIGQCRCRNEQFWLQGYEDHPARRKNPSTVHVTGGDSCRTRETRHEAISLSGLPRKNCYAILGIVTIGMARHKGNIMSTRSIWIEIDSLHSKVMLRAIEQGLMPNLARILEAGASAEVCYEIPLQVSAWATAHTGLSVAEHGATAYDQPIPGTYRMRIERRPIPTGTAYWDLLSKMGKRVLVINSVNAFPAPEVNGIQLNDWSVHVAGRHVKPTSFPPDIVESLERELPDDPFAEDDCGSSEFVDAERLVKSISSNLARKKMVFSKLINLEAWDHVHIGIDDLHNLGHVVWDAFEENDPANALVRKALSETDATIGAFLDRAGGDAAAMILLLGGIGRANTWSHMVDKIIAHFEGGAAGKVRKGNIYGVLGRVWSAQPPWLTSRILPLKSYLREFYLGAMRRRRRAYAMPLNEESGAIRINLRGREPNGLVAPGDEYEALVSELRDAFLELRDSRIGPPACFRSPAHP